jgi:hypothetical protein
LKGSFLAGLMFLPNLLAIADEVIEQSFRNASIDGGEVTSWVLDRGRYRDRCQWDFLIDLSCFE